MTMIYITLRDSVYFRTERDQNRSQYKKLKPI